MSHYSPYADKVSKMSLPAHHFDRDVLEMLKFVHVHRDNSGLQELLKVYKRDKGIFDAFMVDEHDTVTVTEYRNIFDFQQSLYETLCKGGIIVVSKELPGAPSNQSYFGFGNAHINGDGNETENVTTPELLSQS